MRSEPKKFPKAQCSLESAANQLFQKSKSYMVLKDVNGLKKQGFNIGSYQAGIQCAGWNFTSNPGNDSRALQTVIMIIRLLRTI
jgi:hypothetical protein